MRDSAVLVNFAGCREFLMEQNGLLQFHVGSLRIKGIPQSGQQAAWLNADRRCLLQRGERRQHFVAFPSAACFITLISSIFHEGYTIRKFVFAVDILSLRAMCMWRLAAFLLNPELNFPLGILSTQIKFQPDSATPIMLYVFYLFSYPLYEGAYLIVTFPTVCDNQACCIPGNVQEIYRSFWCYLVCIITNCSLKMAEIPCSRPGFTIFWQA